MEKTCIIVYGGDSHNHGNSCGLETTGRLGALIDFIYYNHAKSFIIILAAGRDPNKPEHQALKVIMKGWLQTRLSQMYASGEISTMPTIVLAPDDVWGTFNESLAAAAVLKKYGAKECWVVSSLYHIPRILLIWRMIGGYTIHHISSMSGTASKALLEIPKIVKELIIKKKILAQWQ